MRYYPEETVKEIMEGVKVDYVPTSQYDSSLCTEKRTYPRLENYPSIEMPTLWHKGTPTEEGWYLVKYQCVLEGKYKGRLSYRTIKRYKDKIDNFIYEEGGIGHDDVWMPIEYQKIDDLWEGN